MIQNIDFKKAYVLHSRSYRETSYIVDLFTRDFGRMSVLARGIKKSKLSWQGLLQPFIALKVNWRGKGDLPTLCHVEQADAPNPLKGSRLLSGFYLNELIVRLVHAYDPHEKLFDVYHIAIQQFAQAVISEEIVLRRFEKELLAELGYALELRYTADLRLPIQPDLIYRFIPHKGFIQEKNNNQIIAQQSSLFLGEHLLAISDNQYAHAKTRIAAKRLMRLALWPLLGNRSLKSRELFCSFQAISKMS